VGWGDLNVASLDESADAGLNGLAIDQNQSDALAMLGAVWAL
jgi:hypothetical protein